MQILFLQKRLLFPTDTGWKIRTLNVVRHLARWHEVTYLCNAQPDDHQYVGEMQRLGLRVETVPQRPTARPGWRFYAGAARNLLSRYPLNVANDYDRRLRLRLAELLAREPYDLLVCDFVQTARNCLGLAGPPKLLFQHNVEAEIFHRHAASGSSGLRSWYMRRQAKKMRRFEAAAGRQFDAVVAVSPRDRETFEREYGWRHVHVIDTAVDTDYFQPNGYVEQPDRVVFTGSMDWFPNEDGVVRFVREGWPLVRQARPNAVFQIVGRNPSRAVARLAEVPGVEVVGTVPDVRPYLGQAAVVVVPLWIGGGTRIKIFEAMAMGKPVVSTPLGAEGLPVEPDRHVVLADNPHQLARAVSELLNARDRRHLIAEAARSFVVPRFSAETVARQFETICTQVVGVHSSPCAAS